MGSCIIGILTAEGRKVVLRCAALRRGSCLTWTHLESRWWTASPRIQQEKGRSLTCPHLHGVDECRKKQAAKCWGCDSPRFWSSFIQTRLVQVRSRSWPGPIWAHKNPPPLPGHTWKWRSPKFLKQEVKKGADHNMVSLWFYWHTLGLDKVRDLVLDLVSLWSILKSRSNHTNHQEFKVNGLNVVKVIKQVRCWDWSPVWFRSLVRFNICLISYW